MSAFLADEMTSSDTVVPSRLLPNLQIEWSDESCVWQALAHAPARQASMQAYHVHGTRCFEFDFIAVHPQLDSLSVSLATYQGPNKAAVWCELMDGSGTILARSLLEPGSIADNSFPALFDLRGINFRLGAKYRVRLSCPTAGVNLGVAVWTFAAPEGAYQFARRIKRFRNRREFTYHRTQTPEAGALRCVVVLPPATTTNLEKVSALTNLLREQFPALQLELADLSDLESCWSRLREADVAIFANVFQYDLAEGIGFDNLCFELHRRGTCTIFADHYPREQICGDGRIKLPAAMEIWTRRLAEQRRRCHYMLLGTDFPKLIDVVTGDEVGLADQGNRKALTPELLRQLVANVRRAQLPRVAIVSPAYRKAYVIPSFLEHVARQSYPGEISVVLVDNGSPDNDGEQARIWSAMKSAGESRNMSIDLVEIKENIGNCGGRLAGIEAVDADIYIVIDCDCLINREFVAAHVFEHWWRDVDVVIGPLNIESGSRSGAAVVAALEADPKRIKAEFNPQDPVQLDGFVNCVTRNFSIKRRGLTSEPLFDLDFAHSSKPGSGFGWEDIEMGYRLYARGAVIRYTELAFSVHCSHPASMLETNEALGSMRNFLRLFEKHPEMIDTARHWAVDTYDKIVSRADRLEVDGGVVREKLDLKFAERRKKLEKLLPLFRRERRPLRVLTYRWHVPHQYELYKLPHEFTLVTQISGGFSNHWSFDQRPLRDNACMARASDIDPRLFDVAILHFDENVLAPNLCNGVIPADWGDQFRWFLELKDLPKVAICHGTPAFEGQYALDPRPRIDFAVYQDERQRLVDALDRARVKVVCNSWQAADEWRFKDWRVIRHGFDPQEFPAGRHDLDVLTLDADRDRPHYRGSWYIEIIREKLDPGIKIGSARHFGAPLEVRSENAFAVRNFRSYVDQIGRFTVYLNTTLRSPMPRSRSEAMMTGVIPVCLNNHDVEHFIRHGVNGFYSNEAEELAEYVNYICGHRDVAARMGAEARRTALDIFNHDRYLADWTDLLTEAIG